MSSGAPSERIEDPRTALAVSFATQSLQDPHAITDALWAELKAQFSDVELAELVYLIGHFAGAQLMNVLLQTDVAPPQSC